MTRQDTQPPAETLAEAMHCALKDAAAIATAEADRLAKEMPMGSRSEGTARAIAADITRLAVAALTRRAGGDAIPAGWIVSNADTTRWRTWQAGSPAWTEDRQQATRYHRREDAEAVHGEDEDAWRVVPFEASSDDGLLRKSMERIADLSERWTDSLVSQINEIARNALAEMPAVDARHLCRAFREASRGLGRAGTAEWPGGPYMAMGDAAAVYADLMLGGTGRNVTPAGGDAGAVGRVLAEKLREVAALEDSNLRKHASAVRRFATEAADYLAALALPTPVVEGE